MINKNGPIFKAICSMSSPIDAERDYIECKILDSLFADPALGNKLVFAGGATLSKSYSTKYRLSHDLDLACTEFTEIPPSRTKRQLHKFKTQFKEFVFDQLRTDINYAINQDLRFMITTDREWRVLHNPEQQSSYPALHVLYKSMLNNSLKHICIEIIPRKYDVSAISWRTATPYSIDVPTRKIRTVAYAQTFWDKVFALHSIATNVPRRNNAFISRHYVDVAQMIAHVNIGNTFHLFQDTVAYQTRYTTKEIAPINSAADVCLVPDRATLDRLWDDYYSHHDQFIKSQPAWTDVVNKLNALKVRLNNLNKER